MDQFNKFIISIDEINQKKLYTLKDNIHGFDENYNSPVLDYISTIDNAVVDYEHYLPEFIKEKYSNLNITFNLDLYYKNLLGRMHGYEMPFEKNKLKNFLCCFSGSEHVSRQFLSAILSKSKLWNNNYCTKNFSYTLDQLDGNISYYLDEKSTRLYRKFFVDYDSDIYSTINAINYKHIKNLLNLKVIDRYFIESFIAIVPECLGTSSVPYITEKFLNPVLTKTLFVSYGQPGWHDTLVKVHGFKLYDKIFDYSFDQINNPVIRLVKLIEMVSKFQHLTELDWHDLYLIEKDTIEYNYDYYHSKSYLKNLAKFV